MLANNRIVSGNVFFFLNFLIDFRCDVKEFNSDICWKTTVMRTIIDYKTKVNFPEGW